MSALLSFFILPVLAGYLVLSNFYFSRYQLSQDSNYTVLFKSILAGISLYFFAYLLSTPIKYLITNFVCIHWLASHLIDFFQELVDKDIDPLNILSLAIAIMAIAVFKVIEHLRPNLEIETIHKSIRKVGDKFIHILEKSQSSLLPVIITLDSKKVYVGIVRDINITDKSLKRDIFIWPIMSGYRDESLKFAPTNSYEKIYNELKTFNDRNEKNQRLLDLYENFGIALNFDDIKSLSFSIPEIMNEALKEDSPKSSSTTEYSVNIANLPEVPITISLREILFSKAKKTNKPPKDN